LEHDPIPLKLFNSVQRKVLFFQTGDKDLYLEKQCQRAYDPWEAGCAILPDFVL
jgi:hypothetical protein